jgi:hypothetical protein
MNTGYLIYRAERPLSRAEQRQVDITHAEMARTVSSLWHALTAPLRALRSAGRAAGHPARRQAGLPAGYQAAGYQSAGYQAAEGLAECQAGECLTGHPA